MKRKYEIKEDIRDYETKNKDYRVCYGNRLYLKINSNGFKHWQYSYNRSWVGLGSASKVDLLNARVKASKIFNRQEEIKFKNKLAKMK